MTVTTSRRAVLAGAASLPALALPAVATPHNYSADAELIELGDRFEALLASHMNATFEWALLARAANSELKAHPKFVDRGRATDQQVRAQIRVSNAIHKRNGCDAASDRMSALFDRMEPIAEKIKEIPATTVAGLRAKALVVLFEAMPIASEHSGEFEMGDDGGASRSLFYAVAAITGLAPMVSEIEGRLAADATTGADAAVQS